MPHTEGDNSPRTISFGRFVIDVVAGRLLSHGAEIPLRPQTFSVLRYLAERPGRTVPTDEIIGAVWPEVIGSDDLLVQSIAELRRALADPGGDMISYELEQGARLDPDAAPPERRQAPGVQPLRFRWNYGLIAPFVVAIVFAVIWFATSREPSPARPVADTAVAVLPFQNQSDDEALAIETDQFTRSLILALDQETTLDVKTWDHVAVYQGVMALPGEVARVLAVRYQVTGSVRIAGEQIRVSAQLVDAQGTVLWSARYVEPAADPAPLVRRIARELAVALARAL